MHALAGAEVSGIWFLVADWSIRSVDLRVDRGSTRSLADFSPTKNVAAVTVISSIASFLFIGGRRRMDPEEMRPLVDCFYDMSFALINACGANVRGLSTVSVRLGAIAAMIETGDIEKITSAYRSLILMTSERTPVLESLTRALMTRKMDQMEIIARSFRAFSNLDSTRVLTRNVTDDAAYVRTLLRGKLGVE
jgi:hypothetical protein